MLRWPLPSFATGSSGCSSSRESELSVHVHVSHPDGEAKFWLTPSVHLALNVGLSALQLRQAQAIVEAHIEEIQNAWHRHFSR